MVTVKSSSEVQSVYDYKVTTIEGQQISLSAYSGRVLLIVNVSSRCGFTKQYAGLQALYQKYHDQGFDVLGFPCNQFGGQEPGDENTIKTFCETTYHVTFPLFAKLKVNGKEADPLFVYLKEQAKGILGTGQIKWNFTKFLIDRNGNVINRFASATTPADLEPEIKVLL